MGHRCMRIAGRIRTGSLQGSRFRRQSKLIAQHAHQFKILQDRFRQASRVTAFGPFDQFKREFDDLMARMDAARSQSLTPPERFFKKARKKIEAGHYAFVVDSKLRKKGNVSCSE